MEFTNVTHYNKKSLNALNRLAGQTIERGKKLFYRTLCTILGVLGLAVGFYLQSIAHTNGALTSFSFLYGIILLFVGIFWYPFQNYTSKRMLLQELKQYHFQFDETGFSCETQLANTHYLYHNLYAISENDHWFALFLDKKHGIIIDKSGFSSGDPSAFGSFIEEKTGLTIQKV